MECPSPIKDIVLVLNSKVYKVCNKDERSIYGSIQRAIFDEISLKYCEKWEDNQQ